MTADPAVDAALSEVGMLQEQARSLLRETESPTVTDLPPIEYQQLKRVDLQLRFRRH